MYVTPGIRDAFTEALTEAAASVHAGDGLERAHHDGPGGEQDQLAKDRGACPASNAAPAAGRATSTATGPAFPPTVLTDLPSTTRCDGGDFGPVVAVLEVPDYEAGLAAINDSRYGLTAGICTESLARATSSPRGPRPAWSR